MFACTATIQTPSLPIQRDPGGVTTPLERPREDDIEKVCLESGLSNLVFSLSMNRSSLIARLFLSWLVSPRRGEPMGSLPGNRVQGRSRHRLTPPDLIIEIDITPSDIDKHQLYAALGAPGFWRFNG
jgi:hypothetical protein